jgi:hypothetical protein
MLSIFFPWRLLTRYSFWRGVTRHGFGIRHCLIFCLVFSICQSIVNTALPLGVASLYSFVTSLAFGVVPQTFILVDILDPTLVSPLFGAVDQHGFGLWYCLLNLFGGVCAQLRYRSHNPIQFRLS